MAEKSLTAAAQRAENGLPSTPKSLARAVSQFTAPERRKLIYQARMILRQPGLDIRGLISPHPYSRILIITPRKVGTAPERNLLKRRVKSLFYQEKLYIFPYDLLVSFKKGSSVLSYAQLLELIKHAITLAPQIIKTDASNSAIVLEPSHG